MFIKGQIHGGVAYKIDQLKPTCQCFALEKVQRTKIGGINHSPRVVPDKTKPE